MEADHAPEDPLPLLDIHMDADVPVFTAIVDPFPSADDDDGGMTAVGLDDPGAAIPDDYRRRFLDWYEALPIWRGAPEDLTHLHRVGRELAEELARILGQPIADETPYERSGHVGRCRCPAHRAAAG